MVLPFAVYCSICGCPLEPCWDVINDDGEHVPYIDDVDIEWLESFRIVGYANFKLEQGEEPDCDSESCPYPFSVSPYCQDPKDGVVLVDFAQSTGPQWKYVPRARQEYYECTYTPGFGTQDPYHVYREDRHGKVVCPVHDVCIAIISRIAQRNAAQKGLDTAFTAELPLPTHGLGTKPEAMGPFTTLHGYYDAMLRLKGRNNIGKDFIKVDWEHGYYGAARFMDHHIWQLEDHWQWLPADPLEIPESSEWVLKQLLPTTGGDKSDSRIVGELVAGPDVLSHMPKAKLESLPSEILSEIALNLPFRSVANLLLTSRSLHARIPLPQAFWRDQILHHKFIDWLWDLDPNECYAKDKAESVISGEPWDWEHLAYQLKTSFGARIQTTSLAFESLNDFETKPVPRASLKWQDYIDAESAPLGLRNRRRIVQIVKDIEKLDKLETIEPRDENGERYTPRKLRLCGHGAEDCSSTKISTGTISQ